MKEERILIVSDFHITSGKNSENETWSPTEDFFWDKEFADFLTYYTDDSKSTILLFNGDLFDFIQVLVYPENEEQRKFDILNSEINKPYGLRCTENACEFQINKVIEGHPVFFKSLADFLCKGNKIIFLPGNHDIQLYWKNVQNRIKACLHKLCTCKSSDNHDNNIKFYPWIFYCPGMIYVEHGSQYEETTSFMNFLNPILPFKYSGNREQIELDFSSFLVRYLTNFFEVVNPSADNIRPLTKYYSYMWKTYPFFLIKGLLTALKFILKTFQKNIVLRRSMGKEEFNKIKENNRLKITQEAEKFAINSSLEYDTLTDIFMNIYKRGCSPTLYHGLWAFIWNLLKPLLKGLLFIAPVLIITLIPDFTSHVLNWTEKLDLPWLTSIVKFLTDINLLQIILICLVTIVILFLLSIVSQYKKHNQSNSPLFPNLTLYLRQIGENILNALDVKYVVFGHTHQADMYKFENSGKYFNTGSWMNTFCVNPYRDLSQFTYLFIENENASLLRWNPETKAAQDVVILDSKNPQTSKEDSFLKIIINILKGS